MGAVYITIEGRFKDPEGRYEEIQQKLIEGFERIGLELDDCYSQTWDDHFKIKDSYLEFFADDESCIGRLGNSLSIIDNGFIEIFPEILLELFYTVNYIDLKEGEKISYDGIELKWTVYYMNIQEIYEIYDEEIVDGLDALEKFTDLFNEEIGFKIVV